METFSACRAPPTSYGLRCRKLQLGFLQPPGELNAWQVPPLPLPVPPCPYLWSILPSSSKGGGSLDGRGRGCPLAFWVDRGRDESCDPAGTRSQFAKTK